MSNIKFIGTNQVELVNSLSGTTISPASSGENFIEFSFNTLSKDNKDYYHFVITGSNVQVSGTIDSVTTDYQFFSLFSGCSQITDASQLQITAPTMKKFCFANMFLDCSNLTTPPQLQATNLAQWCYSSMFGNCQKLSSVPILSATTLAKYCYFGMFYNCKALTSAPNLPAQSLEDWCYNSMFFNCQNLTSISSNFTAWQPQNATTNWVTGIETEGNFYNDNVAFIYGVDNVPEGWKIDYSTLPLTFKSTGNTTVRVNKGGMSYNKNDTGWTDYTPDDVISLTDGEIVTFSGTNETINNSFSTSGNGTLEVYGNPHSLINNGPLTNQCFRFLFEGCSNIVDASNLILPATTLTKECYYGMFDNCSNLSTAPQLPATGLADRCYLAMFTGCKFTSAPSLPATTLADQCYCGMFYDCSNLSTAPQLPATGLAHGCYDSMFYDCTSLSTAPSLPATTLPSQCYREMFRGCTNLSSIDVSFTEWLEDATTYWLLDVAPTGVFTKPSELLPYRGNNYIPDGWRVVNKDAEYTPLTFTGKGATNAVCLSSIGSPDAVTIKYSKNGGAWTNYNIRSIINLAENDTVSFSGANDHFSKDGSNYYKFKMTGTIEADGNIQSLMNYNNSCTDYCYYCMFQNCPALTEAPQLPATTLAQHCYQNMFEYTSIRSINLPATELTTYCYYQMFFRTSSISSVEVNFTEWKDDLNATQYWFEPPNVTLFDRYFIKPTALPEVFNTSHIPNPGTNWTVVSK